MFFQANKTCAMEAFVSAAASAADAAGKTSSIHGKPMEKSSCKRARVQGINPRLHMAQSGTQDRV